MSDLSIKYDAWHSLKISEGRSGFLQPWHRNAARFIPNLDGFSVLEIGCGTGEFAFWLTERFPQSSITAVDFSEAAVGSAQKHLMQVRNSPKFSVENAEDLPFSDRSFDYIISCECLEHVPHPAAMAAEISRVLKPGGRFVLTTENYFNGMILAWLNTWLRKRPFDSGSGVQPYENFFVFWRVREILESAGLSVDGTFSSHFQWLLLPRVAPDHLRTDEFRCELWNNLFRPFGRHFTFYGHRP